MDLRGRRESQKGEGAKNLVRKNAFKEHKGPARMGGGSMVRRIAKASNVWPTGASRVQVGKKSWVSMGCKSRKVNVNRANR